MTAEKSNLSPARELQGAEVLVVDADVTVQKGMERLLESTGLAVTAVGSDERALELVATKFFGVVLVDLDLYVPNNGLALVKAVREKSPPTLVLVLSPRKSFDAAVAAFRAGAHDVVMKAPDQIEYLKTRIVDAVNDATTRRGSGALLGEVRDRLEDFLAQLMETERRVVDLEDRVAGRDPERNAMAEELRVLFVDSDDRLYQGIVKHALPGFAFTLAQNGGEALDVASSSAFHLAFVGPSLSDLPVTMVMKTLKAGSPAMTVVSYEPGGKLEIVEASQTIPLLDKFTSVNQLVEQLPELAEAHRIKLRERRYLSAFRERHFELLRQLGDLRRKIDRTIEGRKDDFSY
jgi:DNA-binding NtrC family response regulator